MVSIAPPKRINSRMLQQSVGQTVRLIGKCLNNSSSSEFLVLECSDHGQVRVKRTGSSMHQILTPFVEVLGQVEMDMTVTEFTIINFGQQFDLDLCDKMLNLAENRPDLF